MRWIATKYQSRTAKESHSQRMLVQKSMSKLSKRKKQRKPAKQKRKKLNWDEVCALFGNLEVDARLQIQSRYAEYVRKRGKAYDTWALLKAMEDYKQEVELGPMNAAAEEYELAMAAQEIISG